jgi:hypothetical protein
MEQQAELRLAPAYWSRLAYSPTLKMDAVHSLKGA